MADTMNANGYKPRPTSIKEGYGRFVGFHHVEYFVANAKQAADWMCARMGFRRIAYKGLETGSRDYCSHVIEQGQIRLVYTSALNPTELNAGPVSPFIQIHGDAARDVAFEVEDCRLVFAKAVESGAVPIHPVVETDGVVTASVQYHEEKDEYGNCDCIHTFVQKPADFSGCFLPGFVTVEELEWTDPLIDKLDNELPVGLGFLDHIVTNRGLNHMNGAVQWYKDKLGFHEFWSVDDSIIHTEYSALNSTVMTDFDQTIKLPINEPAPGGKRKKSQIQEYVEYHGGAGVQHIALRTENIENALTNLRARGMKFLKVPSSYYVDLRARLSESNNTAQAQGHKVVEIDDATLDMAERLNILVDFDTNTGGFLLQIFTEPVEDRPTLFYEIIERHGNDGFGAGNFKALFVAIEREQERRGNLTDMDVDGKVNGVATE